jgi:hypothetical protein
MIGPIPTIGRIVHYTLSDQDADTINGRRKQALDHVIAHRERADGSVIHYGNAVAEGDVYPMTIVRVWGDRPEAAVNGQVHLDGNDLLWVTSVQVGTGPRTWAWPVMV